MEKYHIKLYRLIRKNIARGVIGVGAGLVSARSTKQSSNCANSSKEYLNISE